jgi:beta-barrel assembly-enhancing protease
MIEKANCVFYDGESSIPQPIELSFDTTKALFVFETTKNESNCWEIKDVVFTKKGRFLNLQHGQNPIQNITVEDAKFINSVEGFKSFGLYDKLLFLGFRNHILVALGILTIIGLSYIYFIPWVAEKSVVLIPKTYDDEVGRLFFEQNLQFNSIDTSKTKVLNLFASELKLNQTKKIKFTVVNSDIVNAYALPDGNVVVYTGIIDCMKDYDELVGLIGHEVAHVNRRHSMKMLCRNLSGYVFVSTILGDANGVMAVIGDNINNLQSLSFSREFEQQADIDGFEILLLNKVNPQGMPKLFNRLEDQTGIVLPEFLSTHPITKERINYINKLIKTRKFQFSENQNLKKLFKQLKHLN